MLSKRDNEILTHTGPGTPMGALFRRYWVPALLSEEIPEPDCPPVRIRLLGEDLVAFRDTEGRVGLLREYCAHRRASLFYGRNEESGLRCVYHGWKYDVEGHILETPCEPPNSTITKRFTQPSYPCHEAAGVVFTYMGPPELQPLFPKQEWLTVAPEHVGAAKFILECNYLQALEGDCDSAHAEFLHRGNSGGPIAVPQVDPVAKYEVDKSWCGLRVASLRRHNEDQTYVRVYTFVFPFIGSVPVGRFQDGLLDGYQVVYQVPSDDHTTYRYNFRFQRTLPVSGEELVHHDRVQTGGDFRLLANRTNGFLLDRQRQRTQNYSGMVGYATQDAALTESMGPITDRSQEILGSSDGYVIALRRSLLAAAKGLAKGVEPPGLVYDPERNDFSAATCTILYMGQGDSWREREAELYAQHVPALPTAGSR
jgi:phthalate 4,5-dioxygenase